MDGIRILITGGTFDKHYDELKGVLTFKNSHLPDIIKQVRITVPVELEILQLVDSLEMGDQDRQNILAACRKTPEDRIVITHGTDRMVDTAKVLGPASLNKTIVLTGAMIPYSVAGSDSLFNLGCAFTAVQLLSPGVYITMNGRVFPWDKVRKNYEKGVFEGL
ncbi:asparaginase domain-containing protein [Gracilinema caldarium]|uniref:Asparaginase/glutaminase n=1 Tax=Gracilinema caldarium (strain ATCC 51460 / DSM 7334 / H1) TaxID=744872 RepID=F8F2I8_GRAC1|nr:asparaginase domain-containing protein [Gracilinema caldarium]AEJ19103.1 Asparaginase/glutaminase [Gracilinema caldarium DSM 7334]